MFKVNNKDSRPTKIIELKDPLLPSTPLTIIKCSKRKCNDRVINCGHGSFTPLVFSINGGMSHEGSVFHKHLAEKIANKTGQKYEHIMSWIRCKLSFVIMRSALLCLRGSRSVKVNVDSAEDFSFACDEARL